MNMNAFKYLGIAEKYMKCQEMTWEEMRKCSSAWASAADQGQQTPLSTPTLMQRDMGPRLSMGQTDARNREL